MWHTQRVPWCGKAEVGPLRGSAEVSMKRELYSWYRRVSELQRRIWWVWIWTNTPGRRNSLWSHKHKNRKKGGGGGQGKAAGRARGLIMLIDVSLLIPSSLSDSHLPPHLSSGFQGSAQWQSSLSQTRWRVTSLIWVWTRTSEATSTLPCSGLSHRSTR